MSMLLLGLDMSSALPWFLMGATASLVLTAIWNIMHIRRKEPEAQTSLPLMPDVQSQVRSAELEQELAAAKTAAVRYADETSKLKGELHLVRQSTEQRAGLKETLAELRRGDIVLRNEVVDLNVELLPLRRRVKAHEAQIAALQTQIEAAATTESAVVARLKEQLERQQTLNSNKSAFIAMRDAELDRLEGLLAQAQRDVRERPPADTSPPVTPDDGGIGLARAMAEIERLRAQAGAFQSELTRRFGQIAIRDAELDRLEGLSSDTSALKVERDRMMREISTLNVDLSRFHRVKEVLTSAMGSLPAPERS